MTRCRFRFIMQTIHCCYNINPLEQDRFAKVRPLFDAISKNCILHAPLEDFPSIDKSMGTTVQNSLSVASLFNRAISYRQTQLDRGIFYGLSLIKALPVLKTWNISTCDWMPEFFLDFVDVLKDRHSNVPFKIYFDKFFTSINLLEELKLRNAKILFFATFKSIKVYRFVWIRNHCRL